MTIIVDSPESIAASFGIVDELTAQHGVVISEMVPARFAVDGGHHDGGIDLADYRF